MHLRLPPGGAGRPIQRVLVLASSLLVTGAAVAACGGSPAQSVANLHAATTTTVASSSPTGGSGSQSPVGDGGGPPAQGVRSRSSVGMGGVTVQLAQCMRSHGAPNFPDPNSQGQVTMTGVNLQSASFQAAQRACAKYEPNGGKPPSAAQTQKAIQQALKFSKCMRSHGITDFPDPQISSNGKGVGISIRIRAGTGSDLNPNSPLFQAAQKACQSLAPGAK